MRALLIFVLLLPLTARAESEAEKLYLKGQQAYDALRYDDALTMWEQSYALSKLPALLFNIGQAQRLRGRPGDCTLATASYRKFIELAPKSPLRGQAEGFLAELGPCVANEAKPAVVAPPSAPIVAPQPQPERPSGGGGGGTKRIAGLAIGGAGALLVVTGVAFGVKARGLAGEVEAECADGCDWNLVADKDAAGRSAQTTQFVLYGVGAAALAAGAVVYWLGTKERAPKKIAVQPAVQSRGALVTWSTAW